MIRLPAAALAASLIAAGLIAMGPIAVRASAATPEREQELMAIAASCAAFYQAGFDRLELPVERNEAQRQAFIRVIDRLSARHLPKGHQEPWFMENVVDRTAIVVNIIDLKPDEAIPKIRANLGACDALLPEMNAAAGPE